jgi:RNA polymerase sigma-70 factor (ECF subfamily)
MNQSSLLLRSFVDRQTDLKRYFTARVGSEEAEDIVQEIYLKIVAIQDDREIRNPGAYLYRLGANLMLDRLRHRRASVARDAEWYRSTRVTAPSGEDMLDEVPADEALASKDRLSRLEAALKELPENIQRTFRLHKFEEMSHREVAERLGVSRSLVEKHMMRALKHLVTAVGR